MEDMVCIKAGEYTAEINPLRGGNCVRLYHSGYDAEILRIPDYSKPLDNPYLYGMPILYPNNRISGGGFTFENRAYAFPVNEPSTNCHIHGFLHETPFKITEQGDDYVVCQYQATKENPYCTFPHEFRFFLRYTLTNDGLIFETEIYNDSPENMPNFLGFHTTFNVPFLVGGKADDVRVLAQVKDEIERNMQYLPTGNVLKDDDITCKLCEGTFKPFERVLSRQYLKKDGGRVALMDVSRGLSVVYEMDKKFGFRLIYNGNADEYICIEPQTCMANCLNAPFAREYTGFDYIPAYSSKKYTMKLYVKEISQ